MPPAQPKRARRPMLTSVEEAVAAGVAIIDAEGLEALTIRRLAEYLGIGAMTLYSYFRTKDELLDRIGAQLFGEMARLIPPHGRWDERLMTAMRAVRTILREHPGAAALSLSRRGPLPALDPFQEQLLGLLREAGFPLPAAVNALTALIFYVTGDTIIEHARTADLAESEHARLARLSPSLFPNLSAAGRLFAGQISPAAFDAGLQSMVAGLALQLRGVAPKRVD